MEAMGPFGAPLRRSPLGLMHPSRTILDTSMHVIRLFCIFARTASQIGTGNEQFDLDRRRQGCLIDCRMPDATWHVCIAHGHVAMNGP